MEDLTYLNEVYKDVSASGELKTFLKYHRGSHMTCGEAARTIRDFVLMDMPYCQSGQEKISNFINLSLYYMDLFLESGIDFNLKTTLRQIKRYADNL